MVERERKGKKLYKNPFPNETERNISGNFQFFFFRFVRSFLPL